MSPRHEHREVSSGRASEETTRRFRGALRREVGELEVRLEEAQLRSDALLSAGLDAQAAEVLEESRTLVDDFHRRLESALAAAAVEREAERILASSGDVVDVLGPEADGGGVLQRIPAGIGAAVASLAVLAMALVTLRAPQDRDTRPVADVALASPDTTPDTGERVEPTAGRIGFEWAAGTLSAAELEVLAEVSEPESVAPLLERRRQLLNRLSDGQPVVATVLAELDALVEQLEREGVDVRWLVELERREAEAQQPEPQPDADQPQPPAPEQPEPGSQDAPADEQQEPPSEDDPSEDDGSVFPFDDQAEDDEEVDGAEDGQDDGADASGESDGEKSEDDGGLFGG